MSENNGFVSCLTWPFRGVWDLITFIVRLTGRLLAVLIGIVLMILGVVLTLTVIGAILGIPLVLFGFLIVIRGLW